MESKVNVVRDGSDSKSVNELRRTLSVDTIAPKLTSLFKRKRARQDESSASTPADSESESDSSESDEKQNIKKRKLDSKAIEEFEEREKEYDSLLPEEYRKYRPKGFKFNLPPKDRPIRIYADGVFDLFHLGHMKQLEQAKKAFPSVELVCGIPSDKETHKRKGLTVLTDQQRIETLKHCRWVDEVIADAPWCVTTKFLLEHKIDYVAHDDMPYASTDSDDIYMPIKEKGMFLTTQRTEGISTSDIITKIIRDYDKYLMRNFARGATRKELNVSWLKKNELEFKKHVNDFRSYWMKNKTNINNVSKDLYVEIREYLRGKKFDVASFLETSSYNSSINSDNEDLQSRGSSPLTEFAAKYIGNANKELNGSTRSLLANVKDWIKRDDSHEDLTANSDSFFKESPSNDSSEKTSNLRHSTESVTRNTVRKDVRKSPRKKLSNTQN